MKRRVAAVLVLTLIAIGLSLFPAWGAEEEVIGFLESTLHGTNDPGSTVEETELGNVAADAVRAETGAELALIPGGILYCNLQGGAVTEEDIRSLFSPDQTVVLTELSVAELYLLLEAGVSHITVGTGDRIDSAASSFAGFPQISGFSFRYDASASAQERILEITIGEDDVLRLEDDQRSVQVAMTLEMAEGSYGYAVEEYQATAWSVADCMVDYFTGSEIGVPELGRITCIGVMDNSLVSQISPGTWIAVCMILLACYGIFRKHRYGESRMTAEDLEVRETQIDGESIPGVHLDTKT